MAITAWQKAFQRIFWKNRPSTDTPVGESKLLPMDASIDTIDDRVVTLQSTKAEQSDFLTALKNMTYNSQTGVFTITKFNDSTFTIDTDLEKLAINFDYDDDPTSAHYQNLIITLEDGTVKYVDMSALITEYEFGNTNTINFTVSSSTGIVTANVINGSITYDHLAPALQTIINGAQSYSEESEAWAVGQKNGQDVPITADQYHNNSKYYAQQAAAALANIVTSFNGRNGAVVPTKGDYDITKITPTNGAVEGQIPIVVNKGTAQDPEYEFDLGYASSSGIGTAEMNMFTLRFFVTMNAKFNLSEGAYLAIRFPSNDYPGMYKANLVIGNSSPIAVKVDGTVIPDNSEIGREEYVLRAGETGLFVYDGTYLNLVDKNGGSGHAIEDGTGTSLAQEPTLQFRDAGVSDDAQNQKTIVEVIQEVADISTPTADGIYVCDDGNDVPIGEIEEDYVSVTADGVKTWKQLYNELYGQIDTSKLTNNTRLKQGGQLFTRINDDASSLIFVRSVVSQDTYGNKRLFNAQITLNVSASTLVSLELYQNNTNSYDDRSNDQPSNGTVITLYYGSSKAIANLLTDADNCMLDPQTSVKQAITRTESNIAPIESSTASQAYAVGDQFILNGLLYKATAQINQGGTILPNGNCELSDSIVGQLIPKSGTIECRAVFGTNNSNGTYASSMIPLINADKKTINITSCQAVGTSTELTVLVGRKSAIGFTITHNTSAVSGKTVNVTFTYS